MMTVAGEAISPEAEAVVRAAIRGDAGVTELSPAEAVHCLAGVTLPAGWQWMAKVSDGGEVLWQHGHLTARPLIGGKPGGGLREELDAKLAEWGDTADGLAVGTDTGVHDPDPEVASLYKLAAAQAAQLREFAADVRKILAGGAQ